MKLFIIEKETTRYSGKDGMNKKIPKSPKFLNHLNFRHLGVLEFRHLLYGVFSRYSPKCLEV